MDEEEGAEDIGDCEGDEAEKSLVRISDEPPADVSISLSLDIGFQSLTPSRSKAR